MKPPFQYEELTDCALAWQQDDAVLGVPVHWQHEAGGLRLVQVDGRERGRHSSPLPGTQPYFRTVQTGGLRNVLCLVYLRLLSSLTQF